MKNIYRFILILILTSCSNKTSQTIDFKVGYSPNKEYRLSQTQTSENNVKYNGSDEILSNLKNNGVANPTITNTTSIMKSISKTGELDGNQFPLDIEVLESSNKTLNKGMRMHGKSMDGITKIDSITNSPMTEKKKIELLTSMETSLNNIKYPERKISIGESFEQTSITSMPIADVTIELEIKSIYTLNKIENGVGYFDLNQIYEIKSATKDYVMSLDGTGQGKINYDIEQQFFTKYYSEMEMNLKTELELFNIEIQTKSVTNQTTEIKASR